MSLGAIDIWYTVAVSVVTGGLAGALVRYALDARRQRLEHTLTLHEQWWTEEFQEARRLVFDIVEDFRRTEGRGEISAKFLSSFEQGSRHELLPKFSRLVFFFSDLNVCLDYGVVDRRLAYRFFGDSQYFWFEPLITAVRTRVEHNPRIRWAWEVKSLDDKFGSLRSQTSLGQITRAYVRGCLPVRFHRR